MSKNVNVIIEIPKESNKKYELNKKGVLKFTEKLNPGFAYPANYGFIPKTKMADNDELDILVFSRSKIKPKTKLRARVIGLMKMKDRGIRDDKILAVKTSSTIRKLSKKQQESLKHFFLGYKKKNVEVLGFEGQQKALKAVKAAYM